MTNERDARDLSWLEGRSALVLGGLGFFGSNLTHKLVAAGAKVTILDNDAPDSGANRHNLLGIEGKVRIIGGDIRDEDAIRDSIKGMEAIFCCAGQTSHVASMSDPFLDLDVNCRGYLNLLECVRKYNDEAVLIYSGTRSQIGKMVYSPVDENHPERPLDIYSADKMLAEKYFLLYNSHYGLRTACLRFSNAYGPRASVMNPRLGAVNYMIGRALLGENINVYRPGTQQRDLIFVDDVVHAFLAAFKSERALGEVFMVGSGSSISLAGLAKMIVAVVGGGKWKLIDPPNGRTPIDVGDVKISIQKAGELLNWSPTTSLEAGLTKTVEFYRSHFGLYLNHDSGAKN